MEYVEIFTHTRLMHAYEFVGRAMQVDVDGGGELDIDEFAVLLERVGVEVDAARLRETMDIYDTDGGGTIGAIYA